MQEALTIQTATGVRFEQEGFQGLVKEEIKDYEVGFQTTATRFSFIFRYLNTQYWMGVDIENEDGKIKVQMKEERPSGPVIFGSIEKEETSGQWRFEAKGDMMYVRKGTNTITSFPYANLNSGTFGIHGEAGQTFHTMWVEKEEPEIGVLSGDGEARSKEGKVVLYGEREIGGTLLLEGEHTLSVEFLGEGQLTLANETKEIQGEGSASLTAVCEGETTWGIKAYGELEVSGVQLEKGPLSNPILSKGEEGRKSELHFPNGDRVREEGSLLVRYEGPGHVFECGNIKIIEESGVIRGQSNGVNNPSWPRIANMSVAEAPIEPGKQYVLSYWARSSVAVGRSVTIARSNGQNMLLNVFPMLTEDWKYFEHPFTPTVAPDAQTGFYMYTGNTNGDTTNWVELKEVLLKEVGVETNLLPRKKEDGSSWYTGATAIVTEEESVVTANVADTTLVSRGNGEIRLSWGDEVTLISAGEVTKPSSGIVVPGDEIVLTGEPRNVKAFHEISVWGRAYELSRLKVMVSGSEQEQLLFETSFDEEVSTKEKTFVEATLAPIDGSPILVRDEEGPLRAVTFFDPETGEYRIWNEERFIYDGKTERFSLAFGGLDERFTVELRRKGETLGAGEIEEPFARFVLSDAEKRKLHGEEVSVRYQLKRSYLVDYDRGAFDSFRVYLARNEGVPVTLTHEGNRFSNKRLVTELEMNPLETTRNEGFFFLSKEKQEVTSFRVFMEPNRLRADGLSHGELMIQALDASGTEVIGARIMVEAEDGTIEPIISKESVRMRKGEGSYQYRYHAPYMRTESEGDTMRSHLLIKDLESGIGSRVPIYLSPVTEQRRATSFELDEAPQKLFMYMAYAYGRRDMETLSRLLDTNGDGMVDENELEWLKENLADAEVGRRVKMIEEIERTEGIN